MDYQSTHRNIVKQCQMGNRQAQFELYRLYSQAMYNLCLRMVRDAGDAEDLLQNSFTDVFTNLHTFRFESSIGAWIKRITVNNCINFLKKRKLKIQELEDHFHPVDYQEEEMKQPNLSVEKINKALLKLPDGYRVVFTLYLLEGYDHKEIGQVLGISEATSKSQYSRAKAKLRDILGSAVAVRG